jgi:hypothetical protein
LGLSNFGSSFFRIFSGKKMWGVLDPLTLPDFWAPPLGLRKPQISGKSRPFSIVLECRNIKKKEPELAVFYKFK